MFSFATYQEEATYFDRSLRFVDSDLAAEVFEELREAGVEVEGHVRLFESGMVELPDDAQDEREEELAGSSHARYFHRRQRFVESGGRFPRARHVGWWLLHNCVAHVAIGVAPSRWSFWLHDATSKRLNRLS